MSAEQLKSYLLQIAENVTPRTTLKDIYDQLSLLSDIDESEAQEAVGDVIAHNEVEEMSKRWLK